MWQVKEAEEAYGHIKDRLKGLDGKIVAIDPESGDYFVGETIIDAYEKGVQKHPHCKFFFKRIGAKTAFVVGKI
ncbi:MAG: hypothetical protein AABX37_02720 [Nanoarchaeota archaeon]